MFELAYWFCCVGVEPTLSLILRNSHVRKARARADKPTVRNV
jgi:hypothetical protein